MTLKNAKVLVIDDDEDVLIAFRLLLKSKVKEVVVNKNPSVELQFTLERAVIIAESLHKTINT